MRAGQVIRIVGRGFHEDRLGDVAAMMTYYAVFSLFPMALAAVIVFLLWLWVSNMALLMGAEINDAIQRTREDRGDTGTARAS